MEFQWLSLSFVLVLFLSLFLGRYQVSSFPASHMDPVQLSCPCGSFGAAIFLPAFGMPIHLFSLFYVLGSLEFTIEALMNNVQYAFQVEVISVNHCIVLVSILFDVIGVIAVFCCM